MPRLSMLPDPRLGSLLLGKYHIEELLGEGGSGRVYRATHVLLQAPVAVKFLLAAWAQQSVFRTRFGREARILAQLCHPGIPAAHDYGEDEGELYLIMEYVAGRHLARAMQEHRLGLPIPRVVAIVEQILDVLAAAHSQGIVHRDIKPTNIILYRDDAGGERLKVLDFGLALVDERSGQKRLTRSDQIVGTVYYMSPEQCLGEGVGPAADIYALGVVLYQMLSGRLPFYSQIPAKTVDQHLHEAPPPIDQFGMHREVPPQLAELALWALSKSAAARPTATQLRQALWRAMEPTARLHRTSLPIAPLVACELPVLEPVIPSRDDNPITVEAVVLPARDHDAVVMPRVALWGYTEAHVEKLVRTLWARKVHGLPWVGFETPPDHLSGFGIASILVPADACVVDRLLKLRQPGPHRYTPVLVTDVTDGANINDLIRAGANDMTLAESDEDVLANHVVRLLRRHR
ncbi:MAG: serine/threonine protein kinase [Myxococcales bacterium]|nr:serine/threonine protein kinase [Myxococcales bacterium]